MLAQKEIIVAWYFVSGISVIYPSEKKVYAISIRVHCGAIEGGNGSNVKMYALKGVNCALI